MIETREEYVVERLDAQIAALQAEIKALRQEIAMWRGVAERRQDRINDYAALYAQGDGHAE